MVKENEYKNEKEYPEEKLTHFLKDISKSIKNLERKVNDGKKLLNLTSDINLKLSHLVTEVRDLYWTLGRYANSNGYYKPGKKYWEEGLSDADNGY